MARTKAGQCANPDCSSRAVRNTVLWEDSRPTKEEEGEHERVSVCYRCYVRVLRRGTWELKSGRTTNKALTDRQVKWAQSQVSRGTSILEIAEHLGVSETTIRRRLNQPYVVGPAPKRKATRKKAKKKSSRRRSRSRSS